MKIVVANLKMNLLCSDIKNYRDKLEELSTENKIVICPSSLYLPFFKSNKYKIGSQNVYFEDKGAYTGEISPMQLKSIGAEHAIIGHSERRNYFKEDNFVINKKVINALRNGISPILCIGETKTEKLENDTFNVINKQLTECLNGILDVSNIVIAYEPIWAIGTGIVPQAIEIKDVVNYIKRYVKEKHEQEINVLYGGSVDNGNIDSIMTAGNIDGYLVGTACINIDNFIELIKKIS
mgnify:CR=1 FL=1